MQWSLILLFLMGQSSLISCQLYEYHYVEESKTWSEAQQYCRQNYTDLVTVSNMTDMKRLINESSGSMNEAWIGLFNQSGVNRTWYWSLYGVEFSDSETNWSPGEPNNVGFEVQNCLMIWKNLLWGDTSCTDPQYFLCYDESQTSEKFYLINQKKSWLEAQSYCRENHTDLVSGRNQLMDQQLKDKLSSVGDDTLINTGLFRDTWRWSDGSSFSFRFWNLQFDNDKSNTDPCVKAVFSDGGRWKNDDCNERKPFICYEDKMILIKENKTWQEAFYYCRSNYHDLVSITNPDEQRWIQEKVKNASTPLVWMGLHYICSQSFWLWVNDEVVTYKNWVSGGPEDGCDMSGAMETGGQHQWVKRNDSEKLNFICSKSPQFSGNSRVFMSAQCSVTP